MEEESGKGLPAPTSPLASTFSSNTSSSTSPRKPALTAGTQSGPSPRQSLFLCTVMVGLCDCPPEARGWSGWTLENLNHMTTYLEGRGP